MGSHYSWAAKGVSSEDTNTFAARLEQTLNTLEENDFEIYDVMDAPATTHNRGIVVIGRKPKRLPQRVSQNSVHLNPARLRGR